MLGLAMGQYLALQNLAALAGRVLLATIFVIEGWLKITDYSGTISYMVENGVSGRLLPLVILTELGGGALVAVGLLTRWAAVALAGFCLLTALFFHMSPDQAVHFYKNLAMVGGFLLLAGFGPGDWSLDAWLGARRGTGGEIAR
jgi:putative oxidoreductase